MSSENEQIEEQLPQEQGTRINTYTDLLEEELRLRMQYQREKARMTDTVNGLMTVMQPAGQALGHMNRLFGVKSKPGILSHGADIAIDLLTKKYLFKGSGWLVTLAGSYVIRGVSQFFLNRKKKTDTIWTKEESKKFFPTNRAGNGHDQAGSADMRNQ